jgi:predicted esterase
MNRTAKRIHQGQPVLQYGDPFDKAQAAMIMVHGRGASPEDILSIASELNMPNPLSGFVYLAPAAAGSTWYPYPYMRPLADNEPYLSSALTALGDLVTHVEQAGIPSERIMLLGFSQGACLSLTYAARNARRYAGIAGLSGGLIGPDETHVFTGSLAQTPIFLGCSDIDPHIPKRSVDHSADVLRDLGADVTKRLYPNMGHTVNADEIDFVRGMMTALLTR